RVLNRVSATRRALADSELFFYQSLVLTSQLPGEGATSFTSGVLAHPTNPFSTYRTHTRYSSIPYSMGTFRTIHLAWLHVYQSTQARGDKQHQFDPPCTQSR
ncbi:unnamed protein product, partial [Ectocarpus sp. 4 AP-2014]